MTSTSQARTGFGDRERPAYTRLAALGLVLAGAAPLVLLLGGLLGGLPFDGDSFFFIIVAAVALVGAFLVSRFGTWARIVALVISLLVGAAVFWMAFGLAVPGSFVDFVPGVLLPLGVLLGLGGSIAALVANRRGRTGSRSGAGERRLATAALAIVGLAVVASAVLSLTSREQVDAAAAEGAAPATMEDFSFAEGGYTVAAGTPSRFLVHNADPVTHTFTIPELDVDQVVLPGSEVIVEVTAQAGTYTLYCVPHSNLEEPDPTLAGMASSVVAE